jgi:putative methionine-R-sulfoxide reductase with GAF domain
MRPISTVTDQGNFTGPSAHGSVDGAAPDTGDYWNGNDNQDDVFETLLTDLSASEPEDGTCTVSIYETVSDTDVAPAGSGGSVTYDLEVYEGATQRAVRSGIVPTDNTFTLDNALTFNASVITDWSDIRVRFTSHGSGGSPGGRRGAATSYIDIVTPDAAAASDDLLADDIESASEVTNPTIGQEHALLADDVESASEVTTPVITQEHALLANDVESASEVTTPVLLEVHALLADDIESTSEVTVPVIGQIHSITAVDIESASEISVPVIGGTHVLLADDVESASEVSTPLIGEPGGGAPNLLSLLGVG